VTPLPTSRRNDATDRLQLEASRIAVDLQVIANRFDNLRMKVVAEHVNAAADATAKAVFAMGAVRTIDDGSFVQCFPHLWRACGYKGAEDEGEDTE
jgi:hypothetical protein